MIAHKCTDVCVTYILCFQKLPVWRSLWSCRFCVTVFSHCGSVFESLFLISLSHFTKGRNQINEGSESSYSNCLSPRVLKNNFHVCCTVFWRSLTHRAVHRPSGVWRVSKFGSDSINCKQKRCVVTGRVHRCFQNWSGLSLSYMHAASTQSKYVQGARNMEHIRSKTVWD